MAARPDERPQLTQLLLAAVLLGGLGGGVVGAVAGGLAWPPLGLGFGALGGVYVGALLGVLNAFAMWALGRWALVRPAAATAGLLVSGGSTALILLAGTFDLNRSPATGLVAVAGLLGTGLAPLGVRLAGDPRWYRGPANRRILRIAAGTAMAAAAVGGGVGLVTGLRVDPVTAPFAVLEVGLPAAALGLLLGAAVGVGRVVAAGRRQ